MRGSEHSIASSLNRLDLFQQQFERIKFPADLHLQICRHRSAVAGLKRLQSLAPVAMHWFLGGYAVGEQPAIDAVDVAHALVRQRLALTRDAATVLLLGRRYPKHRTHPWLD